MSSCNHLNHGGGVPRADIDKAAAARAPAAPYAIAPAR